MDYLRRSWAEVDLDAIAANYWMIKSKTGRAKIMSVIKADAYGHGAAFVAKRLEREGTDWFAVSNIIEAVKLRSSGITKPILIFGGADSRHAEILREQALTSTVSSYREAAELSAAAMELGTVLPVHIKVDTGMSRMGFSLHDRDGAVRQIEDATRLPGIVAKGIYTHFASADFDGDEDGIYTRAQFAKMRELLDSLKSRTVRFEMRHCCNSAATVAYPEMHMDMVRVGIVLYGLAPSTHIKSRIMLRPALSLKSAAALVKTLEPGDTVSYGRTFEVTRPTVAAILPIGYADGYLREFGGKAQALINGKRAAVIGRVCMDQCVIDVTDIEGVRPGDVATLIGRQNRDEITVDDLAEIAGCINYQTVCLITDRIPRVYFEDGKKIGAEGPML